GGGRSGGLTDGTRSPGQQIQAASNSHRGFIDGVKFFASFLSPLDVALGHSPSKHFGWRLRERQRRRRSDDRPICVHSEVGTVMLQKNQSPAISAGPWSPPKATSSKAGDDAYSPMSVHAVALSSDGAIPIRNSIAATVKVNSNIATSTKPALITNQAPCGRDSSVVLISTFPSKPGIKE